MEKPVLVARERELAALTAFLDRALAGQGQVCFVTGEAGSGKTSLVTAFAERALDRHGELVAALGQADALTGNSDAYLPFREILAQLTGDVERKWARGAISVENDSRLKKLLRFSGKALAEVGPDLIGIFIPFAGLAARAAAFAVERAGWLDRLEKSAGRGAEPGSRIQQEHILEQYTNVLRTLAERQPLLLVLDDLQWADSASFDLLFRLGRRIAGHPILVVGTYRPDDVALGRGGERHPLKKVLDEFKRYLGDIEIDLAQAQRAAGRAFVDALLDNEPNRLGEGFRQALYDRAGGHPLFTIELLRDMQERGALARDAAGCWVESGELDWSSLPARVEGVIEQRVGRLAQGLREALTIASIEGVDFTAEVVARVQHVEGRGLVRQLSETLERQHRLVSAQGSRRLAGQRLSQYRFQHSLFSRYLYNELGEAERSYLHEDVGLVLEELYGEQAGEIAVQLARHFAAAGLEDKARLYLQQAGAQAAARFANAEALEYLGRALALTPAAEVAARFGLLLSREEVYGRMGRREAQRQDLEMLQSLEDRLAEVLAPDEARRLRAESILRRGGYAEVVGEYGAAEAATHAALEIAGQLGDSHLEARGYRGLGFILWRRGDYAAARESLERTIVIARAGGLRQMEAQGLQHLAVVLWRQGHNDLAKAHFESALAIYCDLGDRRGQGQVLGNLGSVYLGQGDFVAARQRYEESVRIERELGDRRGEVISLANLGIIAKVDGDHVGAYARFAQVREFFAELGDREGEARALGHLAMVLNSIGDNAGARSYCEQGLRILREIGNRQAEGWMLNALAASLHDLGDDESAQAAILQALDIARESGNRSGQAYALACLGRVQAGRGELPAAAETLQQALDIRRELGEAHLAVECMAGLARTFLAQQDLGRARSSAEAILDSLAAGSLEGSEQLTEVYLTCFRVLQANDDPRAGPLLGRAYDLLQKQAARISDPEMRHSFLTNVAVHQEIIAAWESR